MATVTSKTAAAITAIENAEIVSAHVDGSSHLILVKKDNGTIDAGSIATVGVPTGAVSMWAGQSTQIPTGWLLCNGQEISRSTYAALFTAIDTAYGSGNGTTTFNVPNFEKRWPRMEAAARGHVAGADTHSHTIADHFHTGHQHHLDGGTPVGHAKLRMITGSGSNIYADRVDVPDYNTEIRGDSPGAVLATSTGASGVRLGGDTNPGGGAQGVTSPMTAASSSYNSQPPYLNVNFIIKT